MRSLLNLKCMLLLGKTCREFEKVCGDRDALENQLRGLLGVSMGFSDFLMAEVEPSHGRVLEESS